jgi:hypothetical protein
MAAAHDTSYWDNCPKTASRGVPQGLEQPLREWIYDAVNQVEDKTVERVLLRLNLPGPKRQAYEVAYKHGEDPSQVRHTYLAYHTPTKQLVEIADAILELLYLENAKASALGRSFVLERAEEKQHTLEYLLTEVLSVYQLREDGRGLDRRTSASATAARQEAARVAAENRRSGSAAMHLRTAWEAIHALGPDRSMLIMKLSRQWRRLLTTLPSLTINGQDLAQ